METDFIITNHGALLLFDPQNNAAREWLEEVTGAGAQWWTGALAVEHRYAYDLYQDLIDNGFTTA